MERIELETGDRHHQYDPDICIYNNSGNTLRFTVEEVENNVPPGWTEWDDDFDKPTYLAEIDWTFGPMVVVGESEYYTYRLGTTFMYNSATYRLVGYAARDFDATYYSCDLCSPNHRAEYAVFQLEG